MEIKKCANLQQIRSERDNKNNTLMTKGARRHISHTNIYRYKQQQTTKNVCQLINAIILYTNLAKMFSFFKLSVCHILFHYNIMSSGIVVL